MGINTITRKVLHTISMHIRETVLYQHNHLTVEVALSLPLARMNGIRSEETITRKVSSLLEAFKILLTKTISGTETARNHQ